MFGKNLGNVVASEMAAVLDSDEYKQYFGKEAADKCECPKGCDCWEKKGSSHEAKDCHCGDKKSEASVEEKQDGSAIEVESPSLKESFDNLVQKFVSLSEELDELGFDKASASLLGSFDILLKEAAGEPIEQMIEETLQTVKDMGPGVELDVDIDEKEPLVETPDERLMEGDEDFDWEATMKALDEMGLGGDEPVEELAPLLEPEGDKSAEASKTVNAIEKATKEVDEWLQKNASAEDLGQEATVDFELDAELSALLAEDTLDEQLVTTAEDKDEEEEKEEDDCMDADDEDEEFEDED